MASCAPVASPATAGVTTASAVVVDPAGNPPDRPDTYPRGVVASDRPVLLDHTTTEPAPPALETVSGVLVDIDTDTILWERNADEPRAPASTTKLMTALVTMENVPLERPVVVSANAAGRLSVETRMGLVAGQVLTTRELLTGLLTVSANDAAIALADGTMGMDAFVQKMNDTASSLGLRHTHFVNPSGFPDDPGQYASARDLAILAEVVYQRFPALEQLAPPGDSILPATATHPAFPIHNVLSHLYQVYPPVQAAKSGFTDGAGPCLVTVAMRGDHHLVSVLLNAPRMIDQSRELLEWGFVLDGVAPLPAPTPPPPVRLSASPRPPSRLPPHH
jgi:D-alanyl-D-alanine carboxypeptidase (penicillin-binding protein 5/6)